DTTLIDYVSDARAPTPTGAAEIAVPVRSELLLTTGEQGERLKRALARRTGQARDKLAAARLPRPEALLQPKRQRLDYASASLPKAALALVQTARLRLSRLAISPASLKSDIRASKQRLRDTAVRARPALARLIETRRTALASQGKLLETLSYQSTLKRGYTIVRDTNGNLIRSASSAAASDAFKISFGDGDVIAHPDGSSPPTAAKPAKAKPKGDQGSLF
ncbi:MAG TPA: exodeoxyribonuclease VII large subunit, partial [Hyphomonas sp.]|nr:exodeoxyribonuclease VII large subunit [Hyphomonas sp.]